MRALPLLVLLGLGCARRPPDRFLAPDFPARAPSRVAVLPFDNQALDLLAPEQLRRMAEDGLRRRGYAPLPASTVDDKLRELGITDGGQLPALTPQKLGETLGVEGLFYGTVEEFLFQDLGFLLRRIVKVRLKLFSASTASELWEDTGEGATVLAAVKKEEMKRLFAVGMAQKSAENMAKKPLWKESQLAVDRLIFKLPPPGAGANSYPAPIPTPPPVEPVGPGGPPAP